MIEEILDSFFEKMHYDICDALLLPKDIAKRIWEQHNEDIGGNSSIG